MSKNLYSFLAISGFILVLATAYFATVNLQRIKLAQIEIEAQRDKLVIEIIDLGERREQLIKTSAAIDIKAIEPGQAMAELLEMEKQIQLRQADWHMAERKAAYLVSRTSSFIQAGIVLIFLGLGLMTAGCLFWYTRVQRYVDSRLSRKLK